MACNLIMFISWGDFLREMVDYEGLYEILRREKYSEQLQSLPKDFVLQVSDFMKNKRADLSENSDSFSEDYLKKKKNFENFISLFRELMLRRKKKILELVFVASETGIMKKDFGNMLDFERDSFERIMTIIDENDKVLNEKLNGESKKKEEQNKMVIMNDKVEEFFDMDGGVLGPFDKGDLINVDKEVAEILVSGGKAGFVDE